MGGAFILPFFTIYRTLLSWELTYFWCRPSSIQVAAQLGAMRDENRRVWDQLAMERRRTDKLVNVVGRLWDMVEKGFPGSGKLERPFLM